MNTLFITVCAIAFYVTYSILVYIEVRRSDSYVSLLSSYVWAPLLAGTLLLTYAYLQHGG